MNAPLSNEAVMVGGAVKVSAEEAASDALLFAQSKRRRAAETIAHVYRSKRTGLPEADDAADEEEIEVAVGGGFYRAEPDVGIMSGGFEVERTAQRIDNGAFIELTDDEVERIAIDETENCDDGPDPDDARDREMDR